MKFSHTLAVSTLSLQCLCPKIHYDSDVDVSLSSHSQQSHDTRASSGDEELAHQSTYNSDIDLSKHSIAQKKQDVSPQQASSAPASSSAPEDLSTARVWSPAMENLLSAEPGHVSPIPLDSLQDTPKPKDEVRSFQLSEEHKEVEEELIQHEKEVLSHSQLRPASWTYETV